MKILHDLGLGCIALAICVTPHLAVGAVLLRYLDIGEQGFAELLAADTSGNFFTVSAVTKISGRSPLRVIKMDARGNTLATLDIDVDTSVPNISGIGVSAAATDAQGNLVIVGSAGPLGFPLVSPLFPSLTGNGAFVMKLDSQLQRIIFSTLLSGSSTVNAVAVDASGNIYVAGGTDSPNFPITPGAYQTKPPGRSVYGGQNAYAFLTEISPAGDRLLYSTYFGGDSAICSLNPSSCIDQSAGTSATAVAVTPSGAIVLAGSTSALDLPVTAGTLASGCAAVTTSSTGFIAEFAPAGARLEWSTCLNPTERLSDFQTPVQINSIAVDSAGGIVVAGSARRTTFPTTPNTVQPVVAEDAQLPWAGFVAKLSSTGAKLLWSTYLGAAEYYGVKAVAVDPLGNITITGYSDPKLLPEKPNVPLLGDTFVARLSGDGTALQNLYVGSNNAVGLGLELTPAGTFIAMGPRGSLWIESGSGPSLLGTANAASGRILGLVSPSELISLYGIDVGPQSPIIGKIANGAFTSALGEYQVLFDGIAAPLLYVGPTQINAIVPHEVAGQDYTHLRIAGPSGTVDGPILAVRPAEPAIFVNSQTNLAAALNQDSSINSPENPAKPGSIVSIFTTGNGALGWNNGQVVPTNSPAPNPLPVSILVPPNATSLAKNYLTHLYCR